MTGKKGNAHRDFPAVFKRLFFFLLRWENAGLFTVGDPNSGRADCRFTLGSRRWDLYFFSCRGHIIIIMIWSQNGKGMNRDVITRENCMERRSHKVSDRLMMTMTVRVRRRPNRARRRQPVSVKTSRACSCCCCSWRD